MEVGPLNLNDAIHWEVTVEILHPSESRDLFIQEIKTICEDILSVHKQKIVF